MKINIRYSFALKLSLYMITCVVVVFAGVLFHNYSDSKKIILEGIFENAKNTASLMSNRVGLSLSIAEKVSEGVASFIEFSNQTESELLSILRSMVQNHDSIYGMSATFEPYAFNKDKYYFSPYFYKSDGSIKLYSSEYNYFKKDWYTAPKKLGHGVWSEPYFGDGKGVYMVTYSQPIYKDLKGKMEFRGVVECDVALDWLVNVISNIDDPRFKSDYAFVISSKGNFIAHPNKEYYLKSRSIFSPSEQDRDPIKKSTAESMIAGKTGFVRGESSYTQRMSYMFYQPLWKAGWSLGIVIPEDELFYDLNAVTTNLFIIGLIGYVLTVLVMAILASRMAMPLRVLASATYEIGKGDFSVKLPVISSTDEIGILCHSFCIMQKNLIKYIDNLQRITAEKERIEKELSIAREIQQSFLPHKFLQLEQIDIYATLIPARDVGGDLYDFFFIDEKHFCFAIGDVSGKGVPAALFMAVVKTLLRAKICLAMEPSKIFNAMNADLCKENESCMFVTLFLGVLDTETGLLRYCNAGHTPPIIHTANKGFYYFHTEYALPPLGLISDVNYVEYRLELLPEDIFFLYTDGVTEAMSIDEIQFSEEKLLSVLTKNKDETLPNIINSVKTAVEQHALGAVQSDDVTMLVVKYGSSSKFI